MTAPEPRVQVTEYAVTCLPEGHERRAFFSVCVEWCAGDLWRVRDGTFALQRDGSWKLNGVGAWTEAEAIEQAKRVAAELDRDGITVADILARDESRRA